MKRKIIGTILIVVSGAIIVLLLTGGGPILPHIIGPSILAVVGVIVLTIGGKVNQPTN
ncbi:MAG: hypothetical protein HY741_05125 [Chloroflexi bacterium]|nr:hypothetical protein [Chloroflexota bacterium]